LEGAVDSDLCLDNNRLRIYNIIFHNGGGVFMKTVSIRKEDVKREWFVVDATGKVLGRLASQVAHILRGKHKPVFTPHVDTGDHVIIVNAEKIRLTGAKMEQKVYYHHTGYPDGLKAESMKRLMEEKPEKLLRRSIWGMLPKNRLGRAMLKKLRVYRGPQHPHAAQNPKPIDLEG